MCCSIRLRISPVCLILLALGSVLLLPSCNTTYPPNMPSVPSTPLSPTEPAPPVAATPAPSTYLGRLDEYGARPGPRGFRTVVVDAGHGGKDSGAVSRHNGLVEKTIALDVAKRLRDDLSGSFRVYMNRDSDYFVDLSSRVLDANAHPDAISVSIHFNECRGSCAGPETYWWRTDSYTLAKRVQQHLSAIAPYHESRGLVRRRLRLTRNPGIPCILVECGYVSSSREAKYISDSSYRAQIARAIASAIREQAALGDGDLGPLPSPIYAPPSKDTDRRE